ncbi:MAG: metallophosphoesterase family protein [Deltaproteobacteria bacterium]|nr:metallophosphoesterase family protein [Deltaproteobacteria bacterium]
MGRIGVIGDVHAEDEALDRVLAFLADRGVERIMAVGDIVDGPGDADRCCRLLADHAVVSVRGNHDRWFLAGQMRDLPHATAAVEPRSRLFLAGLPRSLALETTAGRLLLCHGLGDDDMADVRPDDEGHALECNAALAALRRGREFELVIAGHTHRRMVRAFDGLTIINGGTLSRGHDPCALVVDLEGRTVSFHDVTDGGVVRVAQAVSF